MLPVFVAIEWRRKARILSVSLPDAIIDVRRRLDQEAVDRDNRFRSRYFVDDCFF